MAESSAPDLLDRLTRGWRAYALIALIALVAGLQGLFVVPPLDRDESRYAQATSQMLERGDFVRIAVQDVPRNKKPIGINWLQSASVAAFSSAEARTIWAYRLPSLAGAILAALACFWGGTALVGRRAAFVGASLLGCCLLLSTEAMIAKTDAFLCGFTALTMAALARVRAASAVDDKNPEARRLGLKGLTSTTDPAGGPALLFWAALAGGVLIKGPITPMVAGLAVLMLGLWEGRWRWMKPLAHPSGPLIAALLIVPWFIAIGIATRGQFFVESVGGDLGRKLIGGDEGHGAPPGLHLLLLPLLAFPFALGLPGAAMLALRAIRAPRADVSFAAIRFLLTWAAPTWIVFELLPTKLVHYTMPVYPALALLSGAGLVAAFEHNSLKARIGPLLMFLIGGAGAAALAGAIALMPYYAADNTAAGAGAAWQAGAVVAALLAIPFTGLLIAKRPGGAALAAVCAGLITVVAARQVLLPQAKGVFMSQEASDALMRAGLHPRQHPDAPRLISVGYEEPSFVFLTRTDTLLAMGNDAPRAARPGQAMIVEGRERKTLERSLAARGWMFAPSGPPVSGIDYSNGDFVTLQPGRVVSFSGGTAPAGSP